MQPQITLAQLQPHLVVKIRDLVAHLLVTSLDFLTQLTTGFLCLFTRFRFGLPQ